MLDIKFIRENQGIVKKSLKDRSIKFDLDNVLLLDTERRKILSETEALKAERNQVSVKVSLAQIL